MRAAGTLLTALALLAVQAPWIACACDGKDSLKPLLVGLLGHADAAHDDHQDDHAHHCCDGIAHAVHGADHAHGHHCHGTFGHTHGDQGERDEPAPTERHEGFRLALLSLPGDVDLDDHAAVPTLFDALVPTTTWHVCTLESIANEPEPPERPRVPASATERLLL